MVLTYLSTREIELHCPNYNSVVTVSRTDELLMDGPAYYAAVFPGELNCMIHRWDVQGSDPENQEVRAITPRLAVIGVTQRSPFCDLLFMKTTNQTVIFITGVGYD